MKTLAGKLAVISVVLFFAISAEAQYIRELINMNRLDQLAVYAPGSVAGQLSSYDTTGGNDDGFSGRYSFKGMEDGKQRIGFLEGPGIIQRIWTPTPTEDTIQFYFDGESTPRIETPFIDLFSGKKFPFIKPVVGNEVGGYYCYLPIPYKKSCKILFKGKMQFFQLQYIQTGQDRVNGSFSPQFTAAEKQALEQVAESWANFTGSLRSALPGRAIPTKRINKRILLKPGTTSRIFEAHTGGRILAIRLSPKALLNAGYKDILLKASWDGEQVAAINCPLIDFFGYAFGRPSMKALPLGVDNGLHYCRLPMPYDKSATIELQYLMQEGQEAGEIPLDLEIEYAENKRLPNEGKFYAVWNREKDPAQGKPFQFLQFRGRGHYIGSILQAQGLDQGMTVFFEGDDRTYIDGNLAIHGTGSEDYFNGGWYALPDRWDQAFSLPTHGCLDYSIPLARTGGYRFYITDKLSFQKDFLMTIEHGPENNAIPVDYVSVALFYADRPPVSNAAPPAAMLSQLVSPRTNVYWLDLLPVEAMSTTASVSRVFVKDELSGNEYNVYKLEGGDHAFAKFRLDIAEAGHYKLYVSYFKGPGSGTFDLNQRQVPVKRGIDAYAPGLQFVEKAFMGNLYIEKGSNTITLVIKDKPAAAERNTVLLQGFMLEK
ncbi:glycoside hydrolase family 172 protein [Flavihumibacter sp. CACIAM 22H1]|uniref:glycoside hydrolase family 172 protein n=1 Tax=Flavihumibacter sp. CACIAM 22H1 TaxID=1812911 RepID=UPI0007A84717|nr:glycoside hydrolase family 172 protein [Flavihumibacter sp. CACIAM 22H1]KYP16592.1 MAG: hypothetical protein A1D16_09245 [Flavihumibacter sp. CACIAM 22H1]